MVTIGVIRVRMMIGGNDTSVDLSHMLYAAIKKQNQHSQF